MYGHTHGHGIHYAMMQLALKYDMSVNAVDETILRSVLAEYFGFRCDHPEEKIDIRRDGTKDHCKWCWSFIEVLQKRDQYTDAMGRVKEKRPLKYRAKRNQFEEDLRKKLRNELEGFPPDQRGGE
jgi:hypothetical protein